MKYGLNVNIIREKHVSSIPYMPAVWLWSKIAAIYSMCRVYLRLIESIECKSSKNENKERTFDATASLRNQDVNYNAALAGGEAKRTAAVTPPSAKSGEQNF